MEQIENAVSVQPVVRVAGLSKSFAGQAVLAGVSFEIARGEMLVVLGPSGSGKTTLLRILAGLETPDAGTILLGGQRANELPPQKRNVGVVFQEHALFRRMTVEQNIAFGLRVRKVANTRVEQTVNRMIDMVRLQEHRGKYPGQLSGGQRQRVAVARALAYKPELLLFDEPFSALDPVTRAELRREVRSLLRSMDVPALFITHDQEEALEMADRIVLLNEGKIEQIGTPFEVYNHPQNEFAATFLGAANVLLGRYSQGEVKLGALRLKTPAAAPLLAERQAVKVVFRPEDVTLNFQPQLLDTPYYLGRAIVEEVSYIGPAERLVVRLTLWPSRAASGAEKAAPRLALADESYAEGFPITVTRTKWEAGEMELAAG
ncbi:MAG TPA: ABC transporter ATP-binding protein, partial [Blastocatellia bacterium]|nr:ABC transporter ATP-binding protein [Blastocatellia bacterium]